MSARYEIKEKIGQGGLGEVYMAFDTQLSRNVALKRMKPVEGTSPEDLLKEAKVLSALQHPNILTVYDVGKDDSGAYVITELLRGETLEQVISRNALAYEDFVDVATQSLEGLIAAQAVGLVHRDLKPGNLMVIWHASGKFQLKILDFGLAKFGRASKQTEDQEEGILGSIFFMAPEQFERAPLDSRTDLYALGCIFYFALTGRHPFNGDTAPAVMAAHLQHIVIPLSTLRPDLPPWLCDWVMWFMNRSPENRPGSAKAALDMFLVQAQAWQAAMQVAPLAAAAAAAPAPMPAAPLAAPPVSSGPGTRRIPASTWEEPVAETLPAREPQAARFPIWIVYTLLPILAAGGLYWFYKSRKAAVDAENARQEPGVITSESILSFPDEPPPTPSSPSSGTSKPPATKTPEPKAKSEPPKPAPAGKPQAAVLKPEVVKIDGAKTELSYKVSRIDGRGAAVRSSADGIGHWNQASTKVVWEIDVAQPGTYSVVVRQSTDKAVPGQSYNIVVGSEKLSAEVKSTKSKTDFENVPVGDIALKAGKAKLEVVPVSLKGDLMNLHSITLTKK